MSRLVPGLWLRAFAGPITATMCLALCARAVATDWYRTAHRRAVIDMHIPDWDERFLSEADGLGEAFLALICRPGGPYRLEVEATLFHQPHRDRCLLSLVNFQKELSNIPVHAISVKLRLENERIRRVRRVAGGETIPHGQQGGVTSFTVPRLDTLAVLVVEVDE